MTAPKSNENWEVVDLTGLSDEDRREVTRSQLGENNTARQKSNKVAPRESKVSENTGKQSEIVKSDAPEPKNTGRFGKGNPGKPKGALSKTTKTAKEAIAIAAEKLGGPDRLVAWAQEDPLNERAFWASIYPKLLPLQVNGPGENGEHLVNAEVTFKIVRPKSDAN